MAVIRRRRSLLIWAGSVGWLCVGLVICWVHFFPGSPTAVDVLPQLQKQQSGQAPVWPLTGLPEFDLVDSYGAKFSKQSMLGHPYVVSFVFTQCAGPCPMVMVAVQRLQNKYAARGVRFATLTVDPENDTPDKLRRFGEFYKVQPDVWRLVTGERDGIYRLIHEGFMMPVMATPEHGQGYQVIHSSNLCLVDSDGVVCGKYNAIDESEMAQLTLRLDRLVESAR